MANLVDVHTVTEGIYELTFDNFRDQENESVIEILLNDFNLDIHKDSELFLKYKFVVFGWQLVDTEVIDSLYDQMSLLSIKQLDHLFFKFFKGSDKSKQTHWV